MKALALIRSSSFDPEAIERLGTVFDRVWSIVSIDYAPAETEDARVRLANVVLAVPPDIPTAWHQEAALTLMRASR